MFYFFGKKINIVYAIVLVIFGVSFFSQPIIVIAEDAPSQQAMIFQQNNAFAESSGLDEIDSDPRLLVALVIQVVSSVLGIALVCYGVYGGYIMMLANGDSEQISMGKKAVTRAIIGSVIIVSAYSVSRFVGSTLQRNVLPNAANGGFTSPQGNGEPQLNDPFYERDDTFCTGITCEENGISGTIFPDTPDNGSGWTIEVN